MNRILYITSTRIGDAILHSGVLAYLVAQHPEARFTIAAGPLAAPLFRAVPRLDEIIVMAKKKRGGHWIDLWRQTSRRRWDLVVDHRGSRTSWFLRAEHRHIAGRPRKDMHKVAEAARILKLEPQDPHIWLDGEAEDEAQAFISHHALASTPLLCLTPGAGAPFKMWPAERFAKLAKALTAPHAPLAGALVAILGGPGEEALAKRAAHGLEPERVVDLVGKRSDLLSTAAILRHAALYVGNDSGLTHLSAAMGAPTLALFGPTEEKLYGPWGPHARIVRSDTKANAADREVLRHAEHSMMADLSTERVVHAATQMLADPLSVPRPPLKGDDRHVRYF